MGVKECERLSNFTLKHNIKVQKQRFYCSLVSDHDVLNNYVFLQEVTK